MKYIGYVICILLLSLTLTSCSGDDEGLTVAGSTEAVTEDVTAVQEEQGTGNTTEAGAAASEISEDTETTQEILQKYLMKYKATGYWRDMYISQKFLITTDKEVISLMALEGAEQTTVISLSEVAKSTQTTVGNMSIVTVYDKTGSSVFINLSVDDADELMKKLTK